MRLARSLVLSSLVSCSWFCGAAHAEVTVKQSGGALKITSDADSDYIVVDGYGALGEVRVTLDGIATAYFGVRDISVQGGAGNDVVYSSGVQIGGSMKVKLGAGDDELLVDTDPDGLGGPYSVFIGGNLDVNLGGQLADKVAIQELLGLTITVGRNLSIRGAADVALEAGGNSSISNVDDIFVGGSLRIESTVAQDNNGDGYTVALDDVNVGAQTLVNLGAGQDLVSIAYCHFARRCDLKLGGGADSVDFRNLESRFNAELVLNGGAGTDTLDAYAFVVMLFDPKTTSFELGP